MKCVYHAHHLQPGAGGMSTVLCMQYLRPSALPQFHLCRDVLNVLGMYPGDPGPPGGDFAGVVARVPPGGVLPAGLQPGDAVFGLAAGSLGSYVHASAKTIVPMPASVRWAVESRQA